MPRSKPTPTDDDSTIEGTATHVEDRHPGNDDDVVESLAAHRAERSLSAIPQRQLVLANEDRMTVHGLITAQLGAQGLTVTPAEFDYFIRVCELRGVNPLFREAHLIKDRDGRITVQIGIDGFRKLSEDTGEYRGLTPAEWGEELYSGPVAAWKDKPNHVRVGVLREGFDQPTYGEAWLDEDGQTDRDGKPIGQWGKRPRTMLEKVAEVRARRKAFPRSLAGLYSDEEIPDAAPRLVGEGEGWTPPAALPASAAPAPAERPVAPADVPEGTWSPPEPPPAPEGLQGPIEKAPDGVRRVRPDSSVSEKYGLRGVSVDKLEVVFRSRGRKYTAMLFNEAALAADALSLQPLEVVSVQGNVEERIWQEGKPPVKELWGVTGLSVLRDNVWIDVLAGAPTLDLAPPDPSPPSSQPVASEVATPSSSATAPAGSSASDDVPPDVTPARPALAPAPPIERKDDDAIAGPFTLRLLELAWSERDGRKFGTFKAAHGSGETLRCVVGDEPPGELEATLGTPEQPIYSVGMDVTAAGFWRNGWMVVSAMGIKPL